MSIGMKALFSGLARFHVLVARLLTMLVLPMWGHAFGQGAVKQEPNLDMSAAMFSALKSHSGTYKGELTGDFAAYARKALKLPSSAKVYVDVKTVGMFEQPGCRRLRADITVPELRWKDSAGMEQSFSYQYEMNLCPDGRPPMPDEEVAPIGSKSARQAQRPSGQAVITDRRKEP